MPLLPVLICRTTLTAQTVPVDWMDISGAHAEGNTLIADDFNAAARSSQTIIADGAGSFQFTVFAQSHHVTAGLTNGVAAATRAQMPFAIDLNGGSSAEVWESGTYKGETTYAVGDVFSFSVSDSGVNYLKNGTAFHTTAGTAVSYPVSLSALPVHPVPGSRLFNATATTSLPATFLVSPAGSHVTFSPDSPQRVASGDPVSFTVVADPGYTRSAVGGSAPAGSFTGNVYTTGPITADCSVVFSASPTTGSAGITAVWANDGADKVVRDEIRATTNPAGVGNSVWDGTVARQFGARNEVVSINFIIEAAITPAADLSVGLSDLTGPGGSVIRSAPRPAHALFTWTGTECELFLVRYLEIKGLSAFGYGLYSGSEPQIPEKLRLPLVNGNYTGGWSDRPHHDKFYPDIAVPMELAPVFSIPAGSSQSVWADIYIPKTAAAGLHTGSFSLSANGGLLRKIPVALTVRNFELPDVPSSKTMLFTGYGTVSRRYTGVTFPERGTPEDTRTLQVLHHQRLMAHRHKISLIGDDATRNPGSDQPGDAYRPFLSGDAFTAANGYAGPGTGVGNGIYSIGTYRSWAGEWGVTQTAIRSHTDQWETWFQTNFPATERFLYLIDESTNYAETETWANWMKTNSGIGRNLASMATVSAPAAASQIPSLTIAASTFGSGVTEEWQNAVDALRAAGRKVMLYNGKRPGQGAFSTECDGVDLREIPWGQHKKGIDRWFFWEATYYNDFQYGQGETDVFNQAKTIGVGKTRHSSYGLQGGNASNGDGVLFYPGTDLVFPASSYGVDGPLASLRLKHWRRGIQDVDYLALAGAKDAAAVAALVQRMVPKAMWELPITDPNDPSYYANVAPSWSMNPDDWEASRKSLGDIIEGSSAPGNGPGLAVIHTPDGAMAIWDDAAKGWILQQSADLSGWSDVGNPISAAGSHTYSGNAKKLFIRLAKLAP
ncbi:MAG: hypothetical protein JWM59_2965 [Verrucomicrobiales bacterium]|nr:hypothetical protein [Verrucomicrobiales bacterium]